jgi:hypothetical protein
MQMPSIQIPLTYYKNKEKCAKVVNTDAGFIIQYYYNDTLFYTEEMHDYSIHYVTDAADNWSLGLKFLPEEIEPDNPNHTVQTLYPHPAWPFPSN